MFLGSVYCVHGRFDCKCMLLFGCVVSVFFVCVTVSPFIVECVVESRALNVSCLPVFVYLFCACLLLFVYGLFLYVSCVFCLCVSGSLFVVCCL